MQVGIGFFRYPFPAIDFVKQVTAAAVQAASI
jgi:hypothetical protein